MSVVKIENLNVEYNSKPIFRNFSVSFCENSINVILGGSGVGKTTLLNVLSGLKDYDGVISGTDKGVSYIFQKDRLIPSISVYKNLDLILRAAEKDKSVRKKRIDDMLKILEISEQRDKLPSQLSGGQAQRVAMARAFLYPAEALLLDEPFRALDTALKSRLLTALCELNETNPRTVIFVTHAIDECLLAADCFYVLGGSPAEIICEGKIELPKNMRTIADERLNTPRNTLLRALFEQ